MNNTHDHIIKDGDSHFVIDPATRSITNTTSNKTSLMQYDHNSERFSFEVNKIVEGHDMSASDSVQIHYLNLSDDRSKREEGAYLVPAEDISVIKGAKEDGSEDKLVFTWLLSNRVTQYAGVLSFAITFVCGGQNGETPTYRWGTAIHNAVVINPTMNYGEVVIQEYKDVIQYWWEKLFKAAEGNIDENSGDPVRFYVLTQAEYDALEAEDLLEPDVVYAIKDAKPADIEGIVDGSIAVAKAVEATKAINYDETTGSIKEKFDEIDSKIENVDTAKNYDETTGTIKDKFDIIDEQLEKQKNGFTDEWISSAIDNTFLTEPGLYQFRTRYSNLGLNYEVSYGLVYWDGSFVSHSQVGCVLASLGTASSTEYFMLRIGTEGYVALYNASSGSMSMSAVTDDLKYYTLYYRKIA